MKKHTLALFALIISIVNLIILLYISRTPAQVETFQEEIEEYPEDIPYDAYRTYTADVILPDSMTFAGEVVPLYRVDVRESLSRELIVNTYLHSSTVQLIKKAPRFFSIIEPILERNGIPDDFKYVAVIESNLNPRAVSPARAVGLWQFLEGTGKEYKLEINSDVDERYSVEKSTQAACAFLRSLYNRFGSWTAAAAAYNMGGGGLNNQMKNQNENNYYNLLLNEETERYVFRILALKQIMTHPRTYNFDVTSTYPIEETKKVRVTQSIDNLASFARQHDISYKTLKRFNPWLRKTSLKVNRGRSYEIDIPVHPELYK